MANKFTEEEYEALRKLIPIADQIKAESEYRAAQRLVLATWRKSVIFIGGFIAALYVLREQIKSLLNITGG